MRKGLVATVVLVLLLGFGGSTLAHQTPRGGQMGRYGMMGSGIGMMGSPEIMGIMMSIHGDIMSLMGEMMR
jgi:hypothetical protein